MVLFQSRQSFSINSFKEQQALLRHTTVQMVAFKMQFNLNVKAKKEEHGFVDTT